MAGGRAGADGVFHPASDAPASSALAVAVPVAFGQRRLLRGGCLGSEGWRDRRTGLESTCKCGGLAAATTSQTTAVLSMAPARADHRRMTPDVVLLVCGG